MTPVFRPLASIMNCSCREATWLLPPFLRSTHSADIIRLSACGPCGSLFQTPLWISIIELPSTKPTIASLSDRADSSGGTGFILKPVPHSNQADFVELGHDLDVPSVEIIQGFGERRGVNGEIVSRMIQNPVIPQKEQTTRCVTQALILPLCARVRDGASLQLSNSGGYAMNELQPTSGRKLARPSGAPSIAIARLPGRQRTGCNGCGSRHVGGSCHRTQAANAAAR